jgi:hypothetical protein
MSKSTLTDAWSPYGTPLWDTNAQGWTDVPLSMTPGTNSQFFWAYSPDYSSTGGDVPDWWLIKYFGTTDVNPMGSYSGDGLTLVYKYQNGLNPTNFSTPPAPTGLTVSYDGNNTVKASWNLPPGPVIGYTVERTVSQPYQINDFPIASGSTTTFSDTAYPFTFPYDLSFSPTMYRVQAHYNSGASDWSGDVQVYQFDKQLDSDTFDYQASNSIASLMRGPSGSPYLAVCGFPSFAVTVRLVGQYHAYGDSGYTLYTTNWNVSASVFTNGIFQIPVDIASTWAAYGNYSLLSGNSGCSIQLFDSRGNCFSTLPVVSYMFDPAPFYDGREQLKENLAFLLRAADAVQPFGFTFQSVPGPISTNDVAYNYPSEYAYSSLYSLDEEVYHLVSGDLRVYFAFPDSFYPFKMNNLYRNFVFSLSDVDSSDGSFTTGVNGPYGFSGLQYRPSYFFATNSLTPLLGQGDSLWTWNNIDLSATNLLESVGVTYLNNAGSPVLGLLSGVTNIFGLPFTSVQVAYDQGSGEQYTTLDAGSELSAAVSDAVNHMYVQAAQPELQTTNYYFARPQDIINRLWNKDLLPGHSAFSVTNTTPLMIVPFGQPFRIAGFAKQNIVKGDPSKYAYLGQYFDKAYMANPDGTRSTNETGILSEYGEFLPTEPGTVILTTKPDLTQTNNLQGECTVHVIKLQLDVNHDGTMDLSYGGPDNTSYYNPFEFWVNDDYDRYAVSFGSISLVADDLGSEDFRWNRAAAVPDCEYRNSLGDRIIPSERDLEDFARLWFCGFDSNLLVSLPPGTSGELSWGDKGNPDTNNPSIDLFAPEDINGGNGYLNDYSAARRQTNTPWLARLEPGQSLIVFSNDVIPQRLLPLIWCGVKKGSGKLTFTITQGGTNILAEASAYIQINDIKQMYERWTVGDDPGIAPTNVPAIATEDLTNGVGAFQYPTNTVNTPYILLLHDYALPRWKKDRYAETAFKRLYWQGYQGRFGLFRWPSDYRKSDLQLDNSESNSWASATGLLNLLTKLNAQYSTNVYLLAHGYGAIAAGEALRLAGTNRLINTYIALQGAVPAQAYDMSLSNRSLSIDNHTPNCYLNYYTPIDLSYFWGVGGAGTYINYFNTNDSFLTTAWRTDQDTKPRRVSLSSPQNHVWDGAHFWRGSYPNPQHLLLFPVDTYEIFSYCDEARCEAIGAQPSLGGPFFAKPNLDLSSLYYPMGGVYSDHDGEFKSYCADDWTFWRAVFTSLGFKLKQ